jgi:hypothetical protein
MRLGNPWSFTAATISILVAFLEEREVLNRFSELDQSLFLIESKGGSPGMASGRQGKNKNRDDTEPVEDLDQKIHVPLVPAMIDRMQNSSSSNDVFELQHYSFLIKI